jgi:hypothetical protein
MTEFDPIYPIEHLYIPYTYIYIYIYSIMYREGDMLVNAFTSVRLTALTFI